MLDELVDYLDEALLVQLAVAGVQDDVDAPLVDGRDEVFELVVVVAELGQVVIESHLAPLGPHYVRLVEVEPDDALRVLLVPLDVVPPQPLLHQALDQLVVVAHAHLVLVERRHLPQHQVVLSQRREPSASGAQRVLVVWPEWIRALLRVLLRALVLLRTLPVERALPDSGRLERGAENDGVEEVLGDAVLLVEEAMNEPDHLLLDQRQLAVVLERLDEGLAAECGRVGPLGQLDVHVGGEPIDLVDVALLELVLLEVIGVLDDLETVLEHELDELVVDLEGLLDAGVVQVRVRLVDDLDGGRLVRALDLDGGGAAVEVVEVVLVETLLALVDVVDRLEGLEREVLLHLSLVLVAALVALIEVLLVREPVMGRCRHAAAVHEVVAVDVAPRRVLKVDLGHLLRLGGVEHATIAHHLGTILVGILLLVLHGLAHLGLDKVLADLVDVDLGQLTEFLDCAIWKSLVAGLDDDEDVLEELPHHLLDAVDDANVEAVEGELEDGAVTSEDEGAEIVEAVPVAHLARRLVDAHRAFAITLCIILAQLPTILVAPILLNEPQRVVKLRVANDHVEVELLHLGLGTRRPYFWSVCCASYFCHLNLLLLRVATVAVVKVDVRLVLDLTTAVLREQVLQLFCKLLQIFIPELRLCFVSFLFRLLV